MRRNFIFRRRTESKSNLLQLKWSADVMNFVWKNNEKCKFMKYFSFYMKVKHKKYAELVTRYEMRPFSSPSQTVFILLVWQRDTIPMFEKCIHKTGRFVRFTWLSFLSMAIFHFIHHICHFIYSLATSPLLFSTVRNLCSIGKNGYLSKRNVANDVFIWEEHFSPFTLDLALLNIFSSWEVERNALWNINE